MVLGILLVLRLVLLLRTLAHAAPLAAALRGPPVRHAGPHPWAGAGPGPLPLVAGDDLAVAAS
eukprot:6411854-Alexandrium_andersonii.AAC.1